MTSAPVAHLPNLPVIRAPNCGSPRRREKNSVIGEAKKSAFSRKNGRFSGKNTSKRWLTVTCGSSDSTWLKSGLMVKSSDIASRGTSFTSIPARPSLRSEEHTSELQSQSNLVCRLLLEKKKKKKKKKKS